MDRQDGMRSIMQRTSDNHLYRRNILRHAMVVEKLRKCNATYLPSKIYLTQQYKKSIYIYKQTVHFDFARCVLYWKNIRREILQF